MKPGFGVKPSSKIKDTLHLGSRIPLIDLENVKTGAHTLVDPYFASLDSKAMIKLKKEYPNFEFVPKKAHEFLKEAIRSGTKYQEIRLDSPYARLIGQNAGFDRLCAEMREVLVNDGRISILTEFEPDKESVCYKYGDSDDIEALYGLLHGRELDELSDEEKQKVAANVCEDRTVNLVRELESAGFKVSFSETNDMYTISRSETAMKEKKRGKRIYLLSARRI